ncbi:cupredoxin domain-containing protein [Domibacillus robiginosus]|uniref:cupredoxin domain-containing protein n=1 Tax=Domibacillus robiginosus TaxID=1071054 RepID=UPI00067DC0DB|nr:cupredoxin domain-containing protein [Domibacillus robiginosus]
MKKKKHWMFFGFLALIFILSACGNSDNEEKTSENMDSMSEEEMENMDMEDSSGTNTSSNEVSGEEVSVVASNWKWEMSKTEFKAGEPVTFSIKGEQGLHGFAIQGTDIDEQIPEGETIKVTWTPEKAGEYTLVCSIACGSGHGDMVQKIIVN